MVTNFQYKVEAMEPDASKIRVLISDLAEIMFFLFCKIEWIRFWSWNSEIQTHETYSNLSLSAMPFAPELCFICFCFLNAAAKHKLVNPFHNLSCMFNSSPTSWITVYSDWRLVQSFYGIQWVLLCTTYMLYAKYFF